MALFPHHGDQAVGQVDLTEYVGFKDVTERVAGQVFNRARDGVGAVVEQGV